LNPDFLNLPASIQVSIVSGYLAYQYAYIGRMHAHKMHDVGFITLAFGLIATLVLVLAEKAGLFISAVLAFATTITLAHIWRRFGYNFFVRDMRKHNVTWSNNDVSALASIYQSTDFLFMQCDVQLKDGTWLKCDDLSTFSNAPHGPMMLGRAGDVAMYVSHVQRAKQKKSIAVENVRDDEWGDVLTYIPAEEIKSIEFRLKAQSTA
jgi:hypothetical protein